MSAPRIVKLAEMRQRKSAKGATYVSGFLGSAQALLQGRAVAAGERFECPSRGPNRRDGPLWIKKRLFGAVRAGARASVLG
jgi:hypothetical protein